MNPSTGSKIWLVTDLEPLPIRPDVRRMRAGLMTQHFAQLGWDVTWFHGAMDWNTKTFPFGAPPLHNSQTIEFTEHSRLKLLPCRGYKRSHSLSRLLHQRSCAASFQECALTLSPPDLVVASYPYPELCLAAARFAAARGIPFFVDIRDPWPDIFQNYVSPFLKLPAAVMTRLYQQSLNEILSIAHGIIGISDAYLHWGLTRAKRQRGMYDRVFHLGYEDDSTQEIPSLPPQFTAETPLQVIFAGTFGATVDLTLVYDCAKLLAKQKESRIRFLVAGGGEGESYWQKLAADLPNIEYLGWLPKAGLREAFLRSHLGLMISVPSSFQSYYIGNKFFGYLSAGLSIIQNSGGEAKEIIQESDCGTTLDAENSTPEGLSNILLRYLEHPSELARQRENALRVFRQRYRDSTIFENYSTFLKEYLTKTAINPIPTQRKVVG